MPGRSDIRAGRAFVELSLKNNLFLKGLRNASDRLKAFGASAMRIGGMLTAAGLTMAGALAFPIKAASDLEETMNKFNVVFGESSEAVKQWGDDFAAAVGRSQRQVADFLAGTQDLLVPMGFDPTAAEAMSKQITSLAVDLASFNNMSDADTLRDLHAALTGSGEVMKKYGVIVSEAAVKQEMLNTGMDPKTATEAQKAQARLAIIMRGTTAAHGDAIRSAGGFANQLKALQGRVEDVAAKIGGVLLPVVTPLLGHLGSLVGMVGEFASANQGLVRILAFVTGGLLAAGVAITIVGASAIAAGFALSGIATIMSTAGAVFASVISPIGVLAGLLVGGVALWAKYSISGQQAVSQLSDGFGSMFGVFKSAFGGIKDALSAGDLALAGNIAVTGLKVVMLKGVSSLTASVGGMFGDFIGAIGTSIASGNIGEAWGTVVSGMSMVWQSFTASVVGAFATAANSISSIWSSIVSQISGFILKLSQKFPTLGKFLLGVDPTSFDVNEAVAVAGDITQDRRQAFDDSVDQAVASANQRAADAADSFAERTNQAAQSSAALTQAEQELEALRKQAKSAADRERNAVASGGGGSGVPGLDGAAAFDGNANRQSIFSTFSSAAAAVAGLGGGNDPVVREVKALRKDQQTQAAELRKIRRAVEHGGLIA